VYWLVLSRALVVGALGADPGLIKSAAVPAARFERRYRDRSPDGPSVAFGCEDCRRESV
jgi:hypothetical protein